MTGNLPMAEQRLAALDKACFLPCEEYSDLKRAVARYKAAGNKYVRTMKRGGVATRCTCNANCDRSPLDCGMHLGAARPRYWDREVSPGDHR